MKLIAGLGNPGPRYAGTRHNAGYAVVDELARRWKTGVTHYERDFEGLVGETQLAGQTVRLLKPATYMNLSGRSVSSVMRFYKLAPAELLVLIDDMDLPVGRIRLKPDGTAGGHKGLADVLQQLGTEAVARLRVGIGKAPKSAAVEFVLSKHETDEREAMAAAIVSAADAAECWVRRGIDAAMNEFNRKRNEEGGPTGGPSGSKGESS